MNSAAFRYSLAGEPDPAELAELASEFSLPPDFRFGVAASGFQTEGGFNGPGEPRNEWADWELSGRVEPSGPAVRFWEDPDTHIELVRGMGLDSFRISIEWARVFPSRAPGMHGPPEPDETAVRRYAEIIESIYEAGLGPLITLNHFTYPRWLGMDAWSRESTVDRFLEFVSYSVGRLGDHLAEAGHPPPSDLITFNEPNGPGPTRYVIGMFPPGYKARVDEAYEVTDRMMAAHVKAYDLIHDLYERKGWPPPRVTTNTFFTWTWGLGQCLIDLLLAREAGVSDDPSDLRSYTRDSALRFHSAWLSDPNRPRGLRALLERSLGRLTEVLPDRRFPRTVEALYTAKRASCLDYLALDYYDPYMSNGLRKPGRTTAMGQRWSPAVDFWEQRFNPVGLALACAATAQNAPRKPVVIAENGMATPVVGGIAYPRPDNLTRDVFIRRNLVQLFVARAMGVDLRGYFHWTLVDNYEWGSYTPRFGIHGVDRTGPTPRILQTDSLGIDAARAYKEAVEVIRAGDPQEIASELLR